MNTRTLPAFFLVTFLAALSSQAFGQTAPCILLGMLGAPCPSDNPGAGPPGSSEPLNAADIALVSHSPVIWLAPPAGSEAFQVLPGTSSTLQRNRHGVTASMTTFGLEPETVHSFWWVVFNNPEYCATTPCSEPDLFNPDVNGGVFGGSGQVTDAFGHAHFQAHVFMGEDPGLERPFAAFGVVAGLVDPFKAEIHMLNRTHGPAAAFFSSEELETALNTFGGGCDSFDCFDVQAAVHLP